LRTIVGQAERGPVVSTAIVVGSLAVLIFSTLANAPLQQIAPVTVIVVVSAVAYRSLLVWQNLLALLIVTILFVPIRRYSLPGHLPFQLEPYRLLVFLVVAAWIASLLVDPRVRLRKSGFERPIGLIAIAIMGSVLVNPGKVESVAGYSVKQITFFASFILVFYLIVSVVRSRATVDYLVRLLVGGGALVALSTIVEARTGYNVFNHLSRVVPLLREEVIPWVGQDGRGDRAYASGQHPIALGAALDLLVPLGIYLAQLTRQKRWWVAVVLLIVGSLATYSRTSVLMLVAIVGIYIWLRPVQMKRLWPALIPALLVLHVMVPGTIGTLKNSFFPAGGLVAQQQADPGTAGSGRLADLGPGLREWSGHPILGQGFGTRVVNGPDANSNILDDQWLGTLLETGIVGVVAWFWLLVGATRRLAREAKRDQSPTGWLAVGLSASIGAYAASMMTYDAFAFIQSTFILFFALGFGAVILRLSDVSARSSARPLRAVST
jgi:polysaccharide biosynthesis protein PslJ